MKLDSLKVLKMMEPNFWKIVQPVRRAQKSQKCTKNEVLGEFWRKSHPFICIFFYLNTKLLTFFENCISGKNLVFELWTKNSRPNRMQDYFDCNISQTSSCVRLNFCVWLNVSRSNKFIQLIQVGVVENELSSKVDFLHVDPQKLQACPRWLKAMS